MIKRLIGPAFTVAALAVIVLTILHGDRYASLIPLSGCTPAQTEAGGNDPTVSAYGTAPGQEVEGQNSTPRPAAEAAGEQDGALCTPDSTAYGRNSKVGENGPGVEAHGTTAPKSGSPDHVTLPDSQAPYSANAGIGSAD